MDIGDEMLALPMAETPHAEQAEYELSEYERRQELLCRVRNLVAVEIMRLASDQERFYPMDRRDRANEDFKEDLVGYFAMVASTQAAKADRAERISKTPIAKLINGLLVR